MIKKIEKIMILTIDTEADNQWTEDGRRDLNLKNIEAIKRMHELLCKYNIIPTYLVSYPVAFNDYSSGIINEFVQDKSCEIGAHLHSWDTPPLKYKYIRNASLNSELSNHIFTEKLYILKDLLESRFSTDISSYRAGRWGISKDHFEILNKAGFIVDSSLRQDYPLHNRDFRLYAHDLYGPFMPVNGCKIIEILPTLYFDSKIKIVQNISYIRRYKFLYILLKKIGLGKFIMLRPFYSSFEEMKTIIYNSSSDYFNMMFHSSEIIPGGSPYYSNWNEINLFYENLEKFIILFKETFNTRSLGLTEYANEWNIKVKGWF